MTLKEERCSQSKILLKIGCNKPGAHTAVSYFTKLGIYWDEERTGRKKIKSTTDDSMMEFWFFG